MVGEGLPSTSLLAIEESDFVDPRLREMTRK